MFLGRQVILMALSGTISKKIGTGNAYTEWLDWVVNSQDINANTSNITVTLKAARTDGYPGYGAYNNYSNNTIQLSVGGDSKYSTSTANIDLRTSSGTVLATWTGNVSHNSDGTLNLALEGYFYFNSSAASSLPRGGYTVSGTAAINTIPRKSTVTCTDANIGSTATVIINRASGSFTHTLTYSFGSLSGTITSRTSATSIGWTLPSSFYGQMPNDKTKIGTVTCETFSGDTSLGTNSCTFTATAVSTVIIEATVEDTNNTTIALTGDSSKLIKFMSTAKATIAASTNNSASITAMSINGTSVTSDMIFEKCETNSFVFSATDSRGYSESQTLTPTMIPYIKLTNNSNVIRDTPTGDTITLAVKGNYFNGNFGASDNTLTITYRYCLEGDSSWTSGVITPAIDGNSYSATLNLSGFSYQKVYLFEITAADALISVVSSVKLLMGVPVFDWGKNSFKFNVNVGINKIPENGALDINGDLYVNGKTIAAMEGVTWTPRVEMRGSAQPIRSSSGTAYKVGNIAVITYTITFSQPLSADEALWITGLPYNIPYGHYPLGDYFLDLAVNRINGHMHASGDGYLLVRRMDEPYTYSVMNTAGNHVKDGTIFSGTFVCTVI